MHRTLQLTFSLLFLTRVTQVLEYCGQIRRIRRFSGGLEYLKPNVIETTATYIGKWIILSVLVGLPQPVIFQHHRI